jgi:hypothetical protein
LPKNYISERNSDPFRPPELSKRSISNKGAPPKATAKPRKPSRILQTLQLNSHNETDSFASERRNTKRTRKNIRVTRVQLFCYITAFLFTFYILRYLIKLYCAY